MENIGYLPRQRPEFKQMLGLAAQNLLTSLPATIVVALISGFDLPILLFASGIGTLVFLLLKEKFHYIILVLSLILQSFLQL